MIEYCILIPDIDGLIASHLDPLHILRLSQVNTYYYKLLESKVTEINYVKTSVRKAVTIGSVNLLHWLLQTESKRNKCIKNFFKYKEIFLGMDAYFMFVCRNGYIDMVKYFIDFLHIHIEELCPIIGDTFNIGISEACFGNQIHIVEMLLDIGLNVFKCPINSLLKGADSFSSACQNGNIKLAMWLISKAEDLNYKMFADENSLTSVFCSMCYLGDGMLSAKWFWNFMEKTNVQINSETIDTAIYHRSRYDDNVDDIKWLIDLRERKYGPFNLHEGYHKYVFSSACGHGNLDIAKYLIKLGEDTHDKINIHDNNESAFVSACKNGHMHVAQWLIELGESTYGRINIHTREVFGDLLYDVCYGGRTDITRWLIELGEKSYVRYNLHSVDEQYFLATYEHFETAKLLIELGEQSYGRIDIHQGNDYVFRNACAVGNIRLVRLLIELGEQSYGRVDICSDRSHALRSAFFLNDNFETFDYLIQLKNNGYGEIDTLYARQYIFDNLFRSGIYYPNGEGCIRKFFEMDLQHNQKININHICHAGDKHPLIAVLSQKKLSIAQSFIDIIRGVYDKFDLKSLNTKLFEVAGDNAKKKQFIIDLNKEYYGLSDE